MLPGHRETLAGLRPVRRAELTALGFLGLGLPLPEIRAASGSYRGEVCWASSGRESRASSSQCTEPAKSVRGEERYRAVLMHLGSVMKHYRLVGL